MFSKIKGDQRGFTLTEILIALAIFAVVGSSVMYALNASTKTIISASEITTAESLTRTVIEYVKRADYVSSIVRTTLDDEIEAGDEEIPLDDASGFRPASDTNPGIVQIEAEVVQYTGIVGNTLTGCNRGYAGTEAVGHEVDTTVIGGPADADPASSSLSSGINAEATELYLGNADDFYDATINNPGLVLIDEELVQYTDIDYANRVLSGCVRGYNGTVATTHDSGTSVDEAPRARMHVYFNAVSDAGIDLSGDPYFGDYIVETGILRLDPQDDGWDDDGLQKIYVLVKYLDHNVLITQDYKVNR